MNGWFSKKTVHQPETEEMLDTLTNARQRRKQAMELFKRQLESVPKVDQVLEAIGNDLSGDNKKGD